MAAQGSRHGYILSAFQNKNFYIFPWTAKKNLTRVCVRVCIVCVCAYLCVWKHMHMEFGGEC